MASLLWYDYETTGFNPAQDRILQFAAIRTDSDLNSIEKPINHYCKPALDTLPQPEAIMVTKISPKMAQEEGLPEPEFIAAIHAQMMRGNTCSLGFNSIRFDDEFTRHTLFRNFYDPYGREWKNGNSRWDIIDMVRLVYALRPDTLNWPERTQPNDYHGDFIPSFALERLAAANEIEHTEAHDALSDVQASIALAKLIKTREPKLYEYCWKLHWKAEVKSILDTHLHKPLLHTSSKISAQRGHTTLIMPLMPHPTNSNGFLVIDLTVEPSCWVDLDIEEMQRQLYMSNKELAEQGLSRIPIKTIHINRSPIIVASNKLLNSEVEQHIGLDKQQCLEHYKQLCDPALQNSLSNKIRELMQKPYSQSSSDPENSLYSGGFLSDSDQSIRDQVRQFPPELLGHFQGKFKDARMNTLLWRYRGRNFPETLTAEETQQWGLDCQQRLQDPEAGAAIAYSDYQATIEELRKQSTNQETLDLLMDLQAWGEQLVSLSQQ